VRIKDTKGKVRRGKKKGKSKRDDPKYIPLLIFRRIKEGA